MVVNMYFFNSMQVVTMPLVTENLKSANIGYLVLFFFAISTLIAYGIYRFFLHLLKMNELSDRGFIFASITLGTIGSLMLLDFDSGNSNNVRICTSYFVLGMGYLIGL